MLPNCFTTKQKASPKEEDSPPSPLAGCFTRKPITTKTSAQSAKRISKSTPSAPLPKSFGSKPVAKLKRKKCCPENPAPRDKKFKRGHWYHPFVTERQIGDIAAFECPCCGRIITLRK